VHLRLPDPRRISLRTSPHQRHHPRLRWRGGRA